MTSNVAFSSSEVWPALLAEPTFTPAVAALRMAWRRWMHARSVGQEKAVSREPIVHPVRREEVGDVVVSFADPIRMATGAIARVGFRIPFAGDSTKDEQARVTLARWENATSIFDHAIDGVPPLVDAFPRAQTIRDHEAGVIEHETKGVRYLVLPLVVALRPRWRARPWLEETSR